MSEKAFIYYIYRRLSNILVLYFAVLLICIFPGFRGFFTGDVLVTIKFTNETDRYRMHQTDEPNQPPTCQENKPGRAPVYHRSDQPLTFQQEKQKVFFSVYFLVSPHPTHTAVEFTSTVCIRLWLNTDIRPRIS